MPNVALESLEKSIREAMKAEGGRYWQEGTNSFLFDHGVSLNTTISVKDSAVIVFANATYGGWQDSEFACLLKFDQKLKELLDTLAR
jgi:hypothetical protein